MKSFVLSKGILEKLNQFKIETWVLWVQSKSIL